MYLKISVATIYHNTAHKMIKVTCCQIQLEVNFLKQVFAKIYQNALGARKVAVANELIPDFGRVESLFLSL